jgi:RimJ/RimL family protein N-acetyltransferase
MEFVGKKVTIRESKPEEMIQIISFEKSNAPFVESYTFERHLALLNDSDCLHLSIYKKENEMLVGHMICFGLSGSHRALELRRITISEKGMGYGREALQLIKEYCFKELQFHRLWLDVYQENTRATALYESEGFIYEGILRECIRKGDRYHSLLLYSILAREYERSG